MSHNVISKENLDTILQELEDEYIKCNGLEPIDFFIVGGAAIIINYSYRLSTMDIDSYFKMNDQLSNAIAIVRDRYALEKDWINNDFVNTPSFSEEILKFAKSYRTLKNGLFKVYVIDGYYLLAMKIKSGRPTGGDLQDVRYIIFENLSRGIVTYYEKIKEAYSKMYKENMDELNKYFLEAVKDACSIDKNEATEIIEHNKDFNRMIKG